MEAGLFFFLLLVFCPPSDKSPKRWRGENLEDLEAFTIRWMADVCHGSMRGVSARKGREEKGKERRQGKVGQILVVTIGIYCGYFFFRCSNYEFPRFYGVLRFSY